MKPRFSGGSIDFHNGYLAERWCVWLHADSDLLISYGSIIEYIILSILSAMGEYCEGQLSIVIFSPFSLIGKSKYT